MQRTSAGALPNPVPDEEHDNRRDRIARIVTVAACAWVLVGAGTSLIGWWLGDERWINFPFPERYGTMLPLTAACLLFVMGALWLMRSEPVPRAARAIGYGLAGLSMVISALVLFEYVARIPIGIDLLLFPETVTALVVRLPGRPTITTSICFLALGIALLLLDARSSVAQRVAELLLLFVLLVGGERLISFLFGQTGLWTPASRLFEEPVLIPMAPWTASCLVALAAGFLFARPRRGLVGLYLARGPGGLLARRILPAAIALPIVFGWLGLELMRLVPHGTVYPLSLVVTFQIAFLLIIITRNALEFERVDIERRRAEEALVEREGLLSGVFDNAGAGIAVVDVEGRPFTANKVLQNMLGYDADELSRMRFTEFTHPDDVALDWGLFQELVRGERDSYRIEKRYVRKDGSQFWVQLNTSVARDARQRPEFVIALLEDITDRRNAEEATRRLTAILEATPDFVGIADASGRAVYINRAGRRLVGVDAADVTGLYIADFHPQASARRVLQEAVPTALREGVWVGETELLGPDGEHLPVSQVIVAHRDSTGRVEYISTIMRDITDRKRMEESQRFLLEAGGAFSGSLDMNTILRSIAELSVPDLADCCTVDLVTDGLVERAAITRIRPDGRRTLRQRMHPSGKEPNPVIAEVVSSGEPRIIPEMTEEWMKKLTHDGRHLGLIRDTRPRSLMIVPLPGRDRVQGVITFMMMRQGKHYDAQDLSLATELASRAGLALDNARLFQESRRATRVRDEVLRVVAHDLRNPLHTISLSADLLREQLPREPAAPWTDTLEIIGRSVAQADHLIGDLLDVARIQAGKLAIEPRPTDTRELASEAIGMQESHAAQRGIELRDDIPQTLPSIHADSHRVLQVFSNLIGNALKFSPAGSTVTVGASVSDGAVRFSIHDNGPGIAESDLPHLFDPFWQARAGTGGAGLGLAIARSIIEAHGGRIWVRSRPGKGSTFFFTLPLAPPQEARAAD